MTRYAPAERPGRRGSFPALLTAFTLLLMGSNVQAGVTQQAMQVTANVIEGCSQLATTSPSTTAPPGTLQQNQLQARCSDTLDYKVYSYTEDSTDARSQTTTQVVVVEF